MQPSKRANVPSYNGYKSFSLSRPLASRRTSHRCNILFTLLSYHSDLLSESLGALTKTAAWPARMGCCIFPRRCGRWVHRACGAVLRQRGSQLFFLLYSTPTQLLPEGCSLSGPPLFVLVSSSTDRFGLRKGRALG